MSDLLRKDMNMAMHSARVRSMRKALFIVAAVIATVFAVCLALYPADRALARVHAAVSPVRTRDAPALPLPHPYGDALPAKGKFLVASRAIADPRFRETVILLIDYDASGATGLIINRPTKVPLAEMLPSVSGLNSLLLK